MSLIGKKVLVVIPFIGEDGKKVDAKTVEYTGLVHDKIMNCFPDANKIPYQMENYVVEDEKTGDCSTIHPAYIKKIFK